MRPNDPATNTVLRVGTGIACLYLLVRGITLIRGNVPRKGSYEYNDFLLTVNIVRQLLHKPDKNDLTRGELLAFGWLYVAGGAIIGIALVSGRVH